MTLNNQRLILLTKFALKAKNHIGAVKVAEMFNNELYAFNILAQANLTDDLELADLSEKISYEFEIGFNLINAMKAYIHNIKEFNGDDEFFHKSKYLLNKLANHLYGIKISGSSYRQAVEELILNVEVGDRTFSINLARKFYRVWRASNKSVAESNNDEAFALIDQKKTFIKLWDNTDNEFFSNLEICVLSYYAESMLDKGYSEKDILLSSRIAKVITIELRNEQINSSDIYRYAIERTQMLFEREELKRLFLIVSREFYHFWLGNVPQKISVM